MMSLEYIQQLAAKQARRARRNKILPQIAWMPGDPAIAYMPNIGSYRPKGWRLLRKLFVDKSGFGRLDEPALTVEQFYAEVKEDFGYAIIEEGEFQVYIGEFRPPKEN
jgi:hypothetical protein